MGKSERRTNVLIGSCPSSLLPLSPLPPSSALPFHSRGRGALVLLCSPYVFSLFALQDPYINKSAMSVQAHFSLQRTYIIFRTLGLRHLTVVDRQNRVVGVITRKDLMPFPLEERLRLQLAPQSPDVGEQPLDSRPWMCS